MKKIMLTLCALIFTCGLFATIDANACDRHYRIDSNDISIEFGPTGTNSRNILLVAPMYEDLKDGAGTNTETKLDRKAVIARLVLPHEICEQWIGQNCNCEQNTQESPRESNEGQLLTRARSLYVAGTHSYLGGTSSAEKDPHVIWGWKILPVVQVSYKDSLHNVVVLQNGVFKFQSMWVTSKSNGIGIFLKFVVSLIIILFCGFGIYKIAQELAEDWHDTNTYGRVLKPIFIAALIAMFCVYLHFYTPFELSKSSYYMHVWRINLIVAYVIFPIGFLIEAGKKMIQDFRNNGGWTGLRNRISLRWN